MGTLNNPVQQSDVAAIILIDTAQVSDLTPFMNIATDVVTRACVKDLYTGQATGYTDTTLNLIATWLSAHFYAIRDPRLQSQGFGGGNGVAQGQTAYNFASTSYGQQAMLIDTEGCLARLSEHVAKGKRGKVGIVHVGGRGPGGWFGSWLRRP